MTDELPDPDLPQDPAIPGVDHVSDSGDAPTPDVKDESAQQREHPETDDEGHMREG